MTDPIALRNRFAMVKGAWDEHLRGVPLLVAAALEHRQPRVLGKALVGLRAQAEAERRPARGADDLLVTAGIAEPGADRRAAVGGTRRAGRLAQRMPLWLIRASVS